MVCLIKSKYEEELNHLTEVLGSYKRAYAVLCCNNGYTLDKTKEGKSSKLYNDLLEYYKGDVNKAEQKKAQLFTSDFTDTYGKWFQDGFEIQEQYKDVFDENGEPILFRSEKQTQEQNYLETPYFGTSNDKISLEEQKSENEKIPPIISSPKLELESKLFNLRSRLRDIYKQKDDLDNQLRRNKVFKGVIHTEDGDITIQTEHDDDVNTLRIDSGDSIFNKISFSVKFNSKTHILDGSLILPTRQITDATTNFTRLDNPIKSNYARILKSVLQYFSEKGIITMYTKWSTATKRGDHYVEIEPGHKIFVRDNGQEVRIDTLSKILNVDITDCFKWENRISKYGGVEERENIYINGLIKILPALGDLPQFDDIKKAMNEVDKVNTSNKLLKENIERKQQALNEEYNKISQEMNNINDQIRLINSVGYDYFMKYHKFEQPYDAERFTTSEQRMEEQYILENAKRDSEGRLLAPNGKPSNLTEKQYVQVRTKAFKDWFGDWENNPSEASKVVDENGEPLVLHHFATDTFNIFDSKFNRGNNKGFYFGTINQAYARSYMEEDYVPNGRYLDVFLNLRNPKLTTFDKRDEDYNKDNDGLIIEVDESNAKDLANFAEDLENWKYFTKEWVVKKPNQIKSATDNIGTFSNENDDIRYNRGANVKVNIIKILENLGFVHKKYDLYFITKGKFKTNENTTYSYNNLVNIVQQKLISAGISPDLINFKLSKSGNSIQVSINENTTDVISQNDQQLTKRNDIIKIFKKLQSIIPSLRGIEFVSNNEALKLTGGIHANSFVKNGVVYVNLAGFNTKDTIIEECLHSFVNDLSIENNNLFNSLLRTAIKNFPQLAASITESYSNKYGFTQNDRNQELVTQVLSRYMRNELEKPSKGLLRAIQRFIIWLKEKLQNLFYDRDSGKYVIDANFFIQGMTFEDIAEILNSGNIRLSVYNNNNIKFNRLWFNKQSYIDRFKEARRKIRAAKDQRLQINKIRTNEERTIQDLFESIESSTLSKDKSYKSKFSETSSIYGDEKQIAFNQNAVREVQMQHQTIAEAIESKSADEVMTAFAEGVLQFVERADTDINNILAMLINAKDNNYDMVYYNIDNFGNRVYQDVNGNSITAATATNTTQTQPFSFDEIQYITKDICGFYDNLLSNVERMLVVIQPGSNPVIDEISRLISDLDLRKKLTHIQNMKRIAQEHMLDFWIKEKIDSQESSELTDDMKKRLSVNIKKWVSAQYDFGDTNSFERICGLFSDAKSPVVRMVVDEIYKMAQETDRRTEEDIDGIKEQYDKALREHSLIGKASMVNPLTYLMQKDRRGLYNGDFIQPINKRQFYTDLEDFKAWLLYGKRKTHDKKHNHIFYTYKNIEDMIKEELGDKDFKLDLDEYGNPDIPITTPELRSIYKDYLRGMNEFMSKYANRRFTREYYAERIDTLSAVTLKAVDSLNSQITAIKKSCTINGKFKPNLLTNSQRAQLQELQKQRLNLSSYYDEFGNEKQIDSDEYQIAADLNSFQNKTSGKIKYNPDYESFDDILNSIQSPIEKRQFQAIFSYVGINPKYLDMIEQSEYDGSDVDIAEGLQEIKELGRDLRKLINLHKLNDTYVSYDWSFIFDIHTKKLTKNGIKFLQKINELQTRIEDIKYAIKPGLKGHFNVIKPGTKKNSVISDAFLGVKCIDGTLGNNDFTFREDGSLSQYLMRAYVQQLEDEGMSVTDAQSKADQLFYTRDGNVLKVFTIPIPHTNTFKYKDGNTIRTENSYKIIPNLLFNKLDVDNSDSKYVNKDYNESDNDFVQPKDEYYHDSQYDKVKNTKPELFKLMQLLQEKLDSRVYKQLPFLQQYDGRLPQIGARSMSILTRNLTNKAGLQIFSNLSTIWNRDVNANEQDTDLYIPEKTKRPDGSEIKNIPIRYVDRLEDPSMVSSDLVGSVVAMIRMANNYKVKIENVNKFETILTNIQENENTQSTHSKQFEDMMNRDIYERRAHTDLFSEDWEHFNWFRKLIFGGSATFLKRIGIVRGISQKVMLACRLVSQIVSMLDPLMCTLVEVGCGRYYNKRDFTKAVTLLIKELPAAMLSLGKSGSYSRTMGIIDSLQLGESLTKRYQNLYRTQIGRVISMVDGMTPFSMGDYFIKALNVNMIYNSTRMYIDNNGNIEFLSKEPFIDKCVENGMSFKEANRAYYNAKTARNCVKVINGQIKITDSRMTPEQYQSIGNRTKKITQTMTRMVLEEDKTWLQTNTWAAFVTMLRTFLLVGISERFRNHNDFIVGETETGEITDRRLNKSDIREARKKHYYRGGFNFMTGFIENGIYRSFFSGIGHILSNTKRMQTVLSSFLFKYKHVSQQDMKNMDLSRQEVYAVSKVLRELGLVTMFVTASVMMNAYVSTLPPDDEHWLLFLINAVLMRQGIEMMTMYNPSTVSDLITSITTLTSSVDRVSQILDLLGDYIGITGHNPDEIIKSSSQYKNRTRQYKALMNAFAYFGTAGWYASMPESMGGGGSYALDKSTQWYANTAPWRLLYKKQNVDVDKPKKKRSRPIGVN